jgi:hypothetical protein
MDSKQGMNLGGGTNRLVNNITNLQQALVTVGNILDNNIKPKFSSLEGIVSRITTGLGGFSYSLGKVAGEVGGGNRIAATPPGLSGTGGTGGTGGGGNGYTMAAGALSIASSAGSFAQLNKPTLQNALQQDLLTNRARAYGFGNMANTSFIDQNGNLSSYRIAQQSSIAGQNNNINNIQNTLAMRGTLQPGNPLDAAQALTNAQNFGLAGAPNVGQVLIGAAAASNLTPGVGLARSVQAQAALQQGSSVNMLRGQFGINIRGADGSMMSVPQVVDQIWNKLNSQKRGSSKITEQDILLSMEPGNAIDSMLNMYFGSDPVLRKQVEDGLLVKAATGGSTPLANVSKKTLQNLGFTTAATTAQSNNLAQQARQLGLQAGSMAAGYTANTQMQTDVSKIATALTPIADSLDFIQQLFKGGGSALGFVGGLLKGAAGIFKADGGPVGGKQPYIVGERGPELFVPGSDGTIIPNHLLPRNRADGGGVKAGGAYLSGLNNVSSTDFAKAMLMSLNIAPNSQNISDLNMWMGKEGGNWNNTAKYNPLNTSYQASGSVNFNSGRPEGGVQAYTSWQQGLEATIATLTGTQAKSRGYTNLINALKSGATNSEFFKAMQASSWDAHHYQGGMSSSTGPVSMAPSATSAGYTLNQLQAGITAGSAYAPGNGTTNHTYNYGGVNVTISGTNQSPDAIAKALKSALANPTFTLGQS